MFSLHGALKNMHRLYVSSRMLWLSFLTKEEVMDLGHSWLLLRALIILAIACPFLIFPALLSLRKKRPDPDNGTEARAHQSTRFAISGLGTWRTQADSRSQHAASNGAVSTTPRRAA
jgi:hypothetical protein